MGDAGKEEYPGLEPGRLGLDLSPVTYGCEALNKTLDCSQPLSEEHRPKEHGVILKSMN